MDKNTVLEKWASCKATFDTRYSKCDEDWLFLHGIDQWDQKIKKKRDRQKRPSLTLNQLQPYFKQVVNEIRQSRMAIKVSPVDDKADIKTAEIFQGLIRNTESQSNAQTAYTTAAANATGAGIGWIVVDVDYVNDDNFEQEPLIRRVLDFKSVYIDPSSTELDGSDAEFAFIITEYTKDQFEKDYPDAEPISFDEAYSTGEVDDMIVIVEHYYKEYKVDTLYEIEVEGEIQVIDRDQKKTLDEAEFPYEVRSERRIDVPTVMHHVYGGQEEPLSEAEFPCDFIPVIPVLGEEVFINGVREFRSLLHHAKDAQRMFNLSKSTGIEYYMLQPKAPWIGPKGSFSSYPQKWAHANSENFTTLEYDVVYDNNQQRLEPPQRTTPPQGSVAMMQEAQSAKEDIRMSMGMPLANMGEGSNEISGVAVRNRQIYGDNATFHIVDNLSVAIGQVGRILINIYPRVYSDRKIARILGEDGTPENVPVNQPYVEEEGTIRAARDGEQPMGIHDLNVGKYDVVCDVGASYSSQRQETADQLGSLYEKDPGLMATTGDLFFRSLDTPLGEEIADRIQSQMPPEFSSDDPQAAKLQEAAQAMQQMQEQLANMDAALQEKDTNNKFDQAVKAEEQQLDRDKFEVDAQKTKADIDKIYADIQGGVVDAQTANLNIDAITAQVSEMQETIEILLSTAEEDMETTEPLENTVEMLEGENE